jgi:hypothetical protein
MATITDMGIASNYRGILQPKLKNRWRVTFVQIGGGLADSRDLTMQAVKVSRPQLDFDEVEIHRYNTIAFIATKHKWSECTMTVEDDVTSGATSVVRDQLEKQQLLIAPGSGPWLATAPEASKYKFGTRIEMLDGGINILEVWHLEGCWIKSANFTDLDYSDGEKVTIDLSVRFDHAHQDIMAYTTGQGNALGGGSI